MIPWHFYSARNLPAITDVRDSISRGGGSVCGSEVGGVVGAAAIEKSMDDVIDLALIIYRGSDLTGE